jgi:ATP-dependent helicase/nuclease subunit A
MMDWSKAQREAIETRGKNILVSAAAGSGKTAVLVERIKELILKDEIGIDRMLVVTFSNAAASEMRERVLSAITDEIEKGSHQDAFLRKQLNLVNRSNISTFHAFAMEVIRRYFYLIEADPNFKICDEPNKVILQSDAMEELFEALFQGDNAGFTAFLNQYAASKNESDVKTMILETHRFIQSLPEPLPWLAMKISDLSVDKEDFFKSPLIAAMKRTIRRSLERSLSCFIKTRVLILQHELTSLVAKCSNDIEQVERLILFLDATASQTEESDPLKKETMDLNDFALALQQVRFEVFKASKDDEAEFIPIKDQVKALRDKGKDLIRRQIVEKYFARTPEEQFYILQQTRQAAGYLFTMVASFDRLYRDRKSQRGLLDFSDIEHYALEILKNPQAASEYREKFRYIFIDEYQDSNIVQETLIHRIKGTDNVFMVGDVKQSIYKFRLAEPELFIDKY